MTRFDLVMNTIAEQLPEATGITGLQAAVHQQLDHPVSIGLLDAHNHPIQRCPLTAGSAAGASDQRG